MIRANMGNAVIDIAAPRNSIASNNVAFSENNPGIFTKPIASNAPSTNGAAIPAKETAAALRARARKVAMSNSTPTRNMYRPTPN